MRSRSHSPDGCIGVTFERGYYHLDRLFIKAQPQTQRIPNLAERPSRPSPWKREASERSRKAKIYSTHHQHTCPDSVRCTSQPTPTTARSMQGSNGNFRIEALPHRIQAEVLDNAVLKPWKRLASGTIPLNLVVANPPPFL